MDRRFLTAIVLGLATTAGLLWLEAPLVRESGRVLGPSSEELMQTASVADLQLQPWRTLWYLHIGPPLFDALRAAVVHTAGRGQPYAQLIVTVDVWLLRLWALAYGATVALLALWIGDQRKSTCLGVALAVVWALQPPALLYPMLLDSTVLAGLGMLWCLYEVWRGRALAAGCAAALLFLTRSHFQWPFALLVALTLYLRGMEWRGLARYGLVVLAVMLPLHTKQWAVFRLPVTSSFFGDSACKSLGISGPPLPFPGRHTVPGGETARTLTRQWKPFGTRNYNQLEWLWESRGRQELYRASLRSLSPRQLLGAYLINTRKLLEPTSSFARSPVTRRLPWRNAYDWTFSGWRLLLVVALCGALWLHGCRWRTALARGALALPVLYVVAVSVLFERNDGMRYRYFVEPVTYALVALSAAEAVRRLSSWRHPRLPGPAAPPAVSG